MKNKFTGSLCVLMCVVMVFSMLAACSVKDKTNDGTTAATLTPNDSWTPGVDADYVYESVQISKVELVELVKDALGDEIADDWNGDMSTLTPEQIQKVEQLANNEGLKVEKDENGNTVIKKDEMVTNPVSQDEINQLMTQASVKDPSNLSDEEYNRLSQVAQSNGYVIATKPAAEAGGKNEASAGFTQKPNDVIIVKPVTTIKSTPTTKAPVKTTVKAENTKATKPVKTTKYVPKTTSVYKPPTAGYVAPMAPETTGIPASSKDWVSTFKASTNDIFVASAATNDGGAVVVGITYVNVTGKVDGSGVSSGLIVKYDKKGREEWRDVLGSTKVTSYEDVAILNDGTIVVVGYTVASDLRNAGEYKCPGTVEGIVVKYNSKGQMKGNIQIVGGSAGDMIYTVAATNDGGYLIGGNTESVDGDMEGLYNGKNYRKSFIFKCNSNGSIEWRSALNSATGIVTSGLAVSDSGVIYATVKVTRQAFYGDTALNDTGKSTGECTVVLKLTPSGSLEWYRTIYGTGLTSLYAVTVSADGGCVIAGNYTSGREGNTFGTFSNIYNGGTTGTADGMIIKLNAEGKDGEGVIGWTCPLIGFEGDFITSIVKIDGGFAVSGYSASTNRDFGKMPNSGNYDAFVYIITDRAEKRALYTFSGSGTDNARTLCANDKAIFVAGSTNSGDGNFAECASKGTKDSAVGFISCLSFDK